MGGRTKMRGTMYCDVRGPIRVQTLSPTLTERPVRTPPRCAYVAISPFRSSSSDLDCASADETISRRQMS
jgi:hypothetical protein